MNRAVTMRTGVPGGEQRCAFQNATLQANPGEQVDYSIATFVETPEGDEAGVAAHLTRILDVMAAAAAVAGCAVSFEVEVGVSEMVDD